MGAMIRKLEATIEPISAEHIEGFHAAFDTVARERRFLTFLAAPPLEDTRRFVLSSLAKGNPHFIALVDGKVIGWCDIIRHGFPSHAHRGSLGMGLLPDHRGCGIGTRLIEAALQTAWESDFTRIELSVHADNGSATALYERSGFVREGLVRDAFQVDGVYRDAISMAIIRR